MAQSKSVQFKESELQQIRSFYEQEKFQLLAKLQHVEEVLVRLDGGVKEISGGATPKPATAVAPARRKPGRPRKTESATEVKAKKAGRPRKRGPKSVWGNFILKRLRQCNRPLGYAELVRDAMVMHNLPASKEKNAKASVLNAAFRLRTHLKKIDTVGLPGKKEKFLVLTSWLEGENKLKAPYDKAFEAVAQTPMGDRGRKPRRPSAPGAAEVKVKARMEAASKAPSKPAAKSAARKSVAKPVAKKATAKPAAKKSVAKSSSRKATAKPAAKRTTAKPAAKTSAPKPAAKKPVGKKAAAKTSSKKTVAEPAMS
jgi:hypothetical protein